MEVITSHYFDIAIPALYVTNNVSEQVISNLSEHSFTVALSTLPVRSTLTKDDCKDCCHDRKCNEHVANLGQDGKYVQQD